MKEVAAEEDDMNWGFEKDEKFDCGVMWVEAIWRCGVTEREEREGGKGGIYGGGLRREVEGVGEIVIVLNK